MPRKPQVILHAGQRFGEPGRGSVVLDPELAIAYPSRPERPERGAYLLCDCGNNFVAKIGNLTRGRVVTCGCKGAGFDERITRRLVRQLAGERGFEIVKLELRRKAD